MFKLGDVVCLKSGPLPMTITALPTEDNTGYLLEWHDINGVLRSMVVCGECLRFGRAFTDDAEHGELQS